MDKIIARKWVDELRSGKHKQGQGSLCDAEGSKCCLGVLSEIVKDDQRAKDTGWAYVPYGEPADFAGEPTTQRRWWTAPSTIQMGGYVPSGVREALGMPYGDAGQFIQLNDAENKTFGEIADEIEKRYLTE